MWQLNNNSIVIENQILVPVSPKPFLLEKLFYTMVQQSDTAVALLFHFLNQAYSREPEEAGETEHFGFCIADTHSDILRTYPALIGRPELTDKLKEDLDILSKVMILEGDPKQSSARWYPLFSRIEVFDAKEKDRKDYVKYPPKLMITVEVSSQFNELWFELLDTESGRTKAKEDYLNTIRENVKRARQKWKELPEAVKKQYLSDQDHVVIFDINTTGLKPEEHEIIQFSAVDLNGSVLYDNYFEPKIVKRWSRRVQRASGLSYEDLVGQASLEKEIPKIQKILDQAEVLGGFYIERFDIPYLIQAGLRFREDMLLIDEAGEYRSLDAFAEAFDYPVTSKSSSLERARIAAHGIKHKYLPNKSVG